MPPYERPLHSPNLNRRIEPLKVRLIGALGLSRSEYASEFLWPHEYHSQNKLAKTQREVAHMAWEAINDGRLAGRLALEFVDQQLSRKSSGDPGYVLYHGSPYDFSRIQPRQANWQDSEGRVYADGPPAICASDSFDLPIVRSLLFDGRPELKDNETIKLVLAKHTDRHGRAHWFTSYEALDAIANCTGNVYAFFRDDVDGAPDLQVPEFLKNRDEYRIYGERPPQTTIAVGIPDLPGDLIVLPNSDAPKLDHLYAYDNPRQLGDELSIASMLPFSGVWPVSYFPK